MAANRKTLDTDLIYLREVYARTSFNRTIPANQVLVANGDDSTRWDYIRVSTFNTVTGDDGVPLYANDMISTLNISTSGPPGLLYSYVDTSAQSLILRAAPPVLAISKRPVPSVTSNAAAAPPDLTNIRNYSTVSLLGVRDILFSTVTDISGAPPAVFVSISSFTSAGYSSISGETYSWRPYLYNVLSIAQDYPTFTSSVQTTWPTGLQNISTSEAYPDYITGDAYFSTVSINMSNYIGYIQPGSTQVVLEVEPTYILPRFLLGSEEYPSLLKSISSYIQYTNASNTTILPGSQNSDMIVSQQSNVYTSNYFNKPMKLPIDSAFIASNWALDGPVGYYTLYHRIPGGMAQLVSGDSCGYYIGSRGGMSNDSPTYVNSTPIQNGVFMSIYNKMPFPLTPEELEQQILNSPAPGGFAIGTITETSIVISWQGAVGAITYQFVVNGVTINATNLMLFRSITPPIAVSVIGKTATFTGLSVGSDYAIAVIAIAVGGAQTRSSTIYVTTAPSAPDNLSVSDVTSNGFIVNWYGAIGAASYTFTLNSIPAIPFSITGNSARFTNLSANTSYLIGITAVNSGGSTTAIQGLFTVTAPSAPTNLRSVVGVDTVILSWTGSEGALSYTYLVNGVPTVPSSYDPSVFTDISATFTYLNADTQYNFIVTAVGTGGNTNSAPQSVTTGGPAMDISASNITRTSFLLIWTGSFNDSTYAYTLNAFDPSYYDISVNTVGRSAMFTGATANTLYSVQIIETYMGMSIYSNPYEVTTNPEAPDPAIVTVGSIIPTGFTLSWTGAARATSFSYSVNGLNVSPASTTPNTATFRGFLPSTTYSAIVTAINVTGSIASLPVNFLTLQPPPVPPQVSSSSITSTGFVISWPLDTNVSTYTYTLDGVIVNPTSTPTSITFTNKTPNTPYIVVVTANNNSNMPASNTIYVTTLRTVPANFTIDLSSVTTSSLVVTWPLDTNVTSYTYTLNGDPSTPSSFTSTSATFSSLSPNRTYNVVVIANNNSLVPTASNILPITTIRLPPAAFTIIQSSVTSTGFVVAWPLDTNVTSYSYMLDASSATPSASTATSATFTNLSSNTPYSVIVTANNNSNMPRASNTLSITTLRPVPSAFTIDLSSVTSSSFVITWPLDTNVTSYTYTLNGSSTSPSSSTSTSATFSALANTSYNVIVIANNNSSVPVSSNTLSVTTLQTAPAAFTITLSSITSTSIAIVWPLDANVNNYTYTLNDISGTPSSSTNSSATFTSLIPNTLYRVVVIANNSSGVPTASNTLSLTTIRSAPDPFIISQTSVTSGNFVVSWPDDPNVTSYTFSLNGASVTPSSTRTSATFRNLASDTSYDVIVTANNNSNMPTPSNTLTVITLLVTPVISSSSITSTGFIVSWPLDTNANRYTYTINSNQAIPSAETASSATFTGLTPNQPYSVTVTARDDNNNNTSLVSNTLSIRTSIDRPTALVVSDISSTTFILNWTGSVGATTYTFVLGGIPTTPTYTPGSTTATFTGLTPATYYGVQVIATDGVRNSLASDAVYLTTL